MTNCKKEVTVLNKARAIDVTPEENKNAPKVD